MQLVLGMIGFYATLFGLWKVKASFASPPEVHAVAAVAHGGDIPSVDSPEFAAWIDAPGNIEIAIASLDK